MIKYQKELVEPKLEKNFHENLFFLEIQYNKSPSKEIKEKLIQYYMKGVDYYSGSQKDLSLYFQTKLLYILKGEDHFEKLIKSKSKPETSEDQNKTKESIQKKIEAIQTEPRKTVLNDLENQNKNFLNKLKAKKRTNRLGHRKSTKIGKLNFSRKIDKQSFHLIKKKVSIDQTFTMCLKKNNTKKNSSVVLNKIDNIINDFDRINTFAIIDYSKKLKKIAKLELESINEKTDKYLDYVKTDNELNLLYDGIPDKNEEEGIMLKDQIQSNKDEWENYDKQYNKEEIETKKKWMKEIDLTNNKEIQKILDNIIQKTSELFKESESI